MSSHISLQRTAADLMAEERLRQLSARLVDVVKRKTAQLEVVRSEVLAEKTKEMMARLDQLG